MTDNVMNLKEDGKATQNKENGSKTNLLFGIDKARNGIFLPKEKKQKGNQYKPNRLRKEPIMRKKLVLIGAGSAMSTQGLLADILKEESLGPWEIGLVDTDPEALSVAYNLAQEMVDTRNADIVVEESTDRKDLLPQAGIVTRTKRKEI